MIVRDFELATPKEKLTEQELFDLLANHIAELIEHRLEFLFSLMYRLDIDERKVEAALSPGSDEPANVALARIVLERQKQRAFTKKFYKQGEIDEEEE